MTEQEKKRMHPAQGCLMAIGYLVITLLNIGAITGSTQYVPAWLLWPMILVILGSPFIIQRLRKQNLKHRYPYGWIMLALFIILFGFSIAFRGTPEYEAMSREMEADRAKEEQAQAERERLQKQEDDRKLDAIEAEATHKIGESFKVGYTRYQVNGIRWQQRIGNEYVGGDADARYLLVRMQIKNEDTQSRMIPSFKLLDENGSSYEESSDRMYLKDALLLDSLNPGVNKRASLLFDVPPEHKYKLVVDGGYWSNDVGLVPLN